MSFIKRYWEGLSERKQAGIRYAGNIAVLVLTVWVTVSVVSYVFTWKQDQSALSGVGVVENAAAKSGLSAGHFLVTESFGLAAFCVVLFLLVWTMKCLWSACPANLKKWFFGMLSLSFLLSWALAFAGRFLNMEYAFGGGRGGRAGARQSDLPRSARRRQGLHTRRVCRRSFENDTFRRRACRLHRRVLRRRILHRGGH